MNELIKKIYEQKLSDGTFEKIVSDNFEKMVNDACKSLFEWNGPIKKQMEEKIKSIMSGVIEGTDFNSYIVKLQAVINESLKNTALSDYKNIAESIKSVVGVSGVEPYQKVSISEILSEYAKYIENELEEEDFDDDEINTDDGTKTAYLECYVSVEDDDDDDDDQTSSFSRYRSRLERKIVVLSHEKDDKRPETRVKFYLEKNYRGEWNIEINRNIKISDLLYLPKFIVYLLSLSQKLANIIIDDTEASTEAELEFEW